MWIDIGYRWDIAIEAFVFSAGPGFHLSFPIIAIVFMLSTLDTMACWVAAAKQ